MGVGEIIHKLRKEKRLTLAELSAKSGVALATLSRIENGRMTGTLKSHIEICKALEITLTDLYKDLAASKKTIEVKPRKTGAEVFLHDKKAASETLASNVREKKMMPVRIEMRKDGATHKEESKPGSEKFIYILSGKVEANIGDNKYNLTRGDSLYFDASLPHHFKNAGADASSLICVVCPPVL